MNISATGDLIWAANNPDGTNDEESGQDDDIWGDLGDDGAWADGDDDGNDDQDTDNSGGSSSGSEFNPAESDGEWPGVFPTPINSLNVITINIRTDRFPEETSWQWSRHTGPEFWVPEDSGFFAKTNSLHSYEKDVQSGELYRLSIEDMLGDGICCLFGRGWFTITNATESSEFPNGSVIWSKSGDEFEDYLEVVIWVNDDGMAHEVVDVPGQGYALVQYDFISGERIDNGERVIVYPETSAESRNVNRLSPGERR